MSLTLWDLIAPVLPKVLRPGVKNKPSVQREPVKPVVPHGSQSRPVVPGNGRLTKVGVRPAPPGENGAGWKPAPPERGAPAKASMQDRYDAVAKAMLEKYQIRVRKWRSGMSGIAWYVTYRDGSVKRLIESPRPRGPMSAAVFLHEIGHHAIGFNVYKPRCLEEYHAWRWSLEQMESQGLNITESVRRRMHMSLWYAVQKAKRRGIREIPAELLPFCERPARKSGRSAHRG